MTCYTLKIIDLHMTGSSLIFFTGKGLLFGRLQYEEAYCNAQYTCILLWIFHSKCVDNWVTLQLVNINIHDWTNPNIYCFSNDETLRFRHLKKNTTRVYDRPPLGIVKLLSMDSKLNKFASMML